MLCGVLKRTLKNRITSTWFCDSIPILIFTLVDSFRKSCIPASYPSSPDRCLFQRIFLIPSVRICIHLTVLKLFSALTGTRGDRTFDFFVCFSSATMIILVAWLPYPGPYDTCGNPSPTFGWCESLKHSNSKALQLSYVSYSDAFFGLFLKARSNHQSGWIRLDPLSMSATRLGQCVVILKGFRQTGIYIYF
jgi:hypothetical protein